MTKFDTLQPAQQAGILCNDPGFQRFAAIRCGLPTHQISPTAAAEYLRTCCRIESRRRLNDSILALTRFHALRTEFDAWSGKIATQRRT